MYKNHGEPELNQKRFGIVGSVGWNL